MPPPPDPKISKHVPLPQCQNFSKTNSLGTLKGESSDSPPLPFHEGLREVFHLV